MNKSLFINFHSGPAFINSCAILDSLKRTNPHTQYFMLTSVSNEDLSKIINHIEGFFFLDQAEIRNCWNTPIFNKNISINLFMNKIKTLLSVKWHDVINVSNNNFAAYLASAFDAENYIGTFIDDNHHVQYTDKYFELTNEVIIPKNIPAPLSERLAKSFDITMNNMSFNRIEDFDKVTSEKFRKFKDNSNSGRLLGIDIMSLNKNLGTKTAYSVIERLDDMGEVFLISDQSSGSISAINDLHQETGRVFKSITCNVITFASVANYLTSFYAADGVFASIASNSNVQTFYICDAYNIKLIQTLGPNSCIITSSELESEDKNRIELAPIHNISLGYNYSRICADNIEFHNADFILSLESNLSKNTNSDLIREKINLGLEKNYLATTVRHTLGALRSLRTDIKTPANANNFIEYIGNLFEVAESSSLASTVTTIFKSRIENNTFEDVGENITYIESQLFELKNNLKLIAIYLENAISIKTLAQNAEA